MVQTMMGEDRMPQAFWDQFGFMICDEVHHMAAERFVYIMQHAKAKYRLGLSATPKRKDGKNPVIHAHIGPVRVYGEVFPLSPVVAVKPMLTRLPSESYKKKDGSIWLRPLRPVMPGRMTPTYQDLCDNPKRNGLIVNAIMQCYRHPNCHHLLVMSSLSEHLEMFHRLLYKAGVAIEDFGWYTGRVGQRLSTEDDLARAATKRVILCTDAQTKEGTDYPAWDTIFLTLPWPDVEQRVGRVVRRDDDRPDKVPRVFDFLDSDGIFQGFYKSRENYYARIKAKVVKVKSG
jgi:superfamily II DNA or RNA helicase